MKTNLIDYIRESHNNGKSCYEIANDILDNYQDYKFGSFQSCMDYLNLVFNKLSICYDFKYTSEKYFRPKRFRSNVIQRDGVCVVSGNDKIQCDVAHLEPLSDNYNFDIDNGILLSTELHRTFDKYLWSINPETHRIEIANGVKNISIIQYIDKELELKLNTNNYLSKHYDRFINLNK